MAYGDRKSGRVDFERGIRVYIMGIDGTWRRECMMVDVSQSGARLRIEGSAEGLDLKEFFCFCLPPASPSGVANSSAWTATKSASGSWRGTRPSKNHL